MLNVVEHSRRKFVPAYAHHPLASTKAVTIEMEYDPDAKAFVTYVKELHKVSSFGDSEEAALATFPLKIQKVDSVRAAPFPKMISRLGTVERELWKL